MFDFSNDDIRKIFVQQFWIFLGGYPLFGPSKCGVAKIGHPSTGYDPIFFSTWSVITPLFYMWFIIDTKGQKKAQKRQNISVGPKPRLTKGYPVLTLLSSASTLTFISKHWAAYPTRKQVKWKWVKLNIEDIIELKNYENSLKILKTFQAGPET